MRIIQPRIYLASQSPRRRELLKQIGVNFEMLLLRSDPRRNIAVDETSHADESPEKYVRRVSQAKAEAGYAALRLRNLPSFPVLAADTTISLDGHIFGKPDTAEQAAAMLRQLSGREHQVLSAVAIVMGEHVEVSVSTSTVRYATLIEHLSGSYSGVMGLPLFETVQLLQRFDYPTP